MPQKPQVLFVLGGPGSGKGTQCDIMKKQNGFMHFSIGQLLREIIESGSKDSQSILQKMKQGQMVESKPIVQLLKKKIQVLFKQNPNYIFMVDGFPRNFQNQQTWQQIIGPSFNVLCLLFIQCDNRELINRLIERGKTSGRADDNAQTIKKRMKAFQEQTQPVVRRYKYFYQQGKTKVLSINGMFSIQEVANDIRTKLRFHRII